jgi:uncharacterized protein (TIRG00374 family)
MTMKRWGRVAWWILGLGLFALLLREVGAAEVWDRLRATGWQIVPILGIAATWQVSNTFAWQVCFDRGARPGFWRLLMTKLAGDAVGNVTPTAGLGGELAKAYMLRTDVDVVKGLPTLVVNKTTEVMSGLVFALLGTAAAFYGFPIPAEIKAGLCVALLVTTAAVLGLFLRQRRNTFGWALDLLRRVGVTRLEARRAKIEETDRNIALFYETNRSGFLISTGLHVLSWALAVVEVYYILVVLGHPLSFAACFLLTSLNLVINTAFFFVPSGVGVFEGGHVFLFHLLGMDPALGLAVGILRRIRRIFWVAIGFALLLLPRRADPASRRPS